MAGCGAGYVYTCEGERRGRCEDCWGQGRAEGEIGNQEMNEEVVIMKRWCLCKDKGGGVRRYGALSEALNDGTIASAPC